MKLRDTSGYEMTLSVYSRPIFIECIMSYSAEVYHRLVKFVEDSLPKHRMISDGIYGLPVGSEHFCMCLYGKNNDKKEIELQEFIKKYPNAYWAMPYQTEVLHLFSSKPEHLEGEEWDGHYGRGDSLIIKTNKSFACFVVLHEDD